MIGVAGSVAVGKSTTSRVLVALLSRWQSSPKVDLVTTDGFLLPQRGAGEAGPAGRKGFPESYDRAALLRFVMDVKSGARGERPRVQPPGLRHRARRVHHGAPPRHPHRRGPQRPAGRRRRRRLVVSDFFDFSVYVDADESDLRSWYLERFMGLRESAFRDPRSYFVRYAGLSDAEARATATASGTPSTAPTTCRTSCPRGGGRRRSCARTPTTTSSGSASGRSERLRETAFKDPRASRRDSLALTTTSTTVADAPRCHERRRERASAAPVRSGRRAAMLGHDQRPDGQQHGVRTSCRRRVDQERRRRRSCASCRRRRHCRVDRVDPDPQGQPAPRPRRAATTASHHGSDGAARRR